jgi:hypothetical protein
MRLPAILWWSKYGLLWVKLKNDSFVGLDPASPRRGRNMVGVSGNRVLQSVVAAAAVICLTISVHVVLSQTPKVGFTGNILVL